MNTRICLEKCDKIGGVTEMYAGSFSLHRHRVQAHPSGRLYRRRFPVCPAAFVDYLFLIRIAPPAGQYSELPLGRQCTIAGTRTENHV